MVQRDRFTEPELHGRRKHAVLVLAKGVLMRLHLWMICLTLAGCQSFQSGDFRRAQVADDPMFSTAEQRVRARSFFAFPNDDELGPRSGQEPRRLWYPRN